MHCIGYDAVEILDTVLASTLKVKRGEAAFERDSVLFDEIQYSWPIVAGLMWAATRSSGKLNVLDLGGALGSGYFQNRCFLTDLSEVCWNVVEQEHFVSVGRAHVQGDQLGFYFSIEECLEENQPNVILLSSALQYLECPFETIRSLSSVGADCLIIDRTPIGSDRRLLVQHVPPSIYPASYPMWVFGKDELCKSLDPDWRVVARNSSPEGRVFTPDGFEFIFEGMLMERRK